MLLLKVWKGLRLVMLRGWRGLVLLLVSVVLRW
jgi:hypothetical protein